MAMRVEKARSLQYHRCREHDVKEKCNSELGVAELEKVILFRLRFHRSFPLQPSVSAYPVAATTARSR